MTLLCSMIIEKQEAIRKLQAELIELVKIQKIVNETIKQNTKEVETNE